MLYEVITIVVVFTFLQLRNQILRQVDAENFWQNSHVIDIANRLNPRNNRNIDTGSTTFVNKVEIDFRITSYNVCYTKLLRINIKLCIRRRYDFQIILLCQGFRATAHGRCCN